jgi:hypothetical protein
VIEGDKDNASGNPTILAPPELKKALTWSRDGIYVEGGIVVALGILHGLVAFALIHETT